MEERSACRRSCDRKRNARRQRQKDATEKSSDEDNEGESSFSRSWVCEGSMEERRAFFLGNMFYLKELCFFFLFFPKG